MALLRSAPVFFMELTAEDYYRLKKIYPFEPKSPGEARYITEQRRRRKMKLHLAKERGYGEIKPLWNAILTLRRGKFTFEEMAIVLETDIDTILFEWDRIQQNAQ